MTDGNEGRELADLYAYARVLEPPNGPEDNALSSVKENPGFERDWDNLIALLDQGRVATVKGSYASLVAVDGLNCERMDLTFWAKDGEEVQCRHLLEVQSLSATVVRQLLNARYPEWKDALGSYGMVTIDVEDQAVRFDHREFVMTARASEATISVNELLGRDPWDFTKAELDLLSSLPDPGRSVVIKSTPDLQIHLPSLVARGLVSAFPISRSAVRVQIEMTQVGAKERARVERQILDQLGKRAPPLTPQLEKALRSMEWGQTKKLNGLIDHTLSLFRLKSAFENGMDLLHRGLVEATYSGDLPVDFVLTPAGIVTKGRLIRAEHGPTPPAPRAEAESEAPAP